MFNQVKLPFTGGRLALADLGFAAAFIGMAWHLLRMRRAVSSPRGAILALALIIVPDVFGLSRASAVPSSSPSSSSNFSAACCY